MKKTILVLVLLLSLSGYSQFIREVKAGFSTRVPLSGSAGLHFEIPVRNGWTIEPFVHHAVRIIYTRDGFIFPDWTTFTLEEIHPGSGWLGLSLYHRWIRSKKPSKLKFGVMLEYGKQAVDSYHDRCLSWQGGANWFDLPECTNSEINEYVIFDQQLNLVSMAGTEFYYKAMVGEINLGFGIGSYSRWREGFLPDEDDNSLSSLSADPDEGIITDDQLLRTFTYVLRLDVKLGIDFRYLQNRPEE